MINISCINNLILYEINLSRPSLSWNDVDCSVVEAVLPSLWQTNSRCPQSLSTLGTTWSVWRPSPLWGLLVHWPRYWAPQDWLNSWQLVVQKYQRQSFWYSGVSIPPEPALPSPEYFLSDETKYQKYLFLGNFSSLSCSIPSKCKKIWIEAYACLYFWSCLLKAIKTVKLSELGEKAF